MTATAVAPTARPRHQARPSWVLRALTALPDRILLVALWVSLVVALLVMFGQFHWWLVVPASLVVLVLTVRIMPKSLPASLSTAVPSLIAVVGAAVWVVVQLPYRSQFVLVTRDPGFYTMRAIWLIDHADPNIDVSATLPLLQQFSDMTLGGSGAYFLDGSTLNVQSNSLVPALLAMAGWVGGRGVILGANLLLGGLALIGVYAAARRIAGPWWGLLAPALLAVGVPLATFSRAAYTEPTAMAMIFGGIMMAWSALSTGSRVQYAVAGLFFGVSAMVRVDGAAGIAGAIASLGLIAGAAVIPAARRRTRAGVLIFAVVACALVGLGLLDVYLNSIGYLRALRSQVTLLILALGASVAGALVLLPTWPWGGIRRWLFRRRAGISWGAGALVLLVAAGLISRPFWLVEHHFQLGTGYASAVANFQKQAGVEVDGTQTYDELSVAWMAWYFGWPAILLTFVGLAFAFWYAVRRRDPRFLFFVGVVGAGAALYLVRVSITPDQVWAIRRLLPIVIPGLLVALSAVLAWAWHRWKQPVLRTVPVLLAVMALAFPATYWNGLFTQVQFAGRYNELLGVCDAVQGSRVVYVDVDSPPYVPSLLSVCQVEAVQLKALPDAATLAKLDKAWTSPGPLRMVTFYGDPGKLSWTADPAPYSVTPIGSIVATLFYAPTEYQVDTSQVFIGTVGEDGRLTPVTR